MSAFSASVVEQAALDWFEALGYRVISGPTIAPGEPGEERGAYSDVVLEGRLREALARLNPNVSAEGREEAFRKLTRIGMQHRNLAVELLRKLLNDEVKARSKQNLVQARCSRSCWRSRCAGIRTARSRPPR